MLAQQPKVVTNGSPAAVAVPVDLHASVTSRSMRSVNSAPSATSTATAIVIQAPGQHPEILPLREDSTFSLNDSQPSSHGIYTKKTDPRLRVMSRRTSHTLLYVPEQRRVSNVSGHSVVSCPCPSELTEESDVLLEQPPRFSLSLSPVNSRRKSVQTGAPAIGFRPLKTFERRASQPSLFHDIQPVLQCHDQNSEAVAVNQQPLFTLETLDNGCSTQNHNKLPPEKQKMLTKRVSWLSMKSLQETEEKIRRPSNGSARGSPSRTASQYGSQVQLDGPDREFDSDTPPLDTLSWSNARTFSLLPTYFQTIMSVLKCTLFRFLLLGTRPPLPPS